MKRVKKTKKGMRQIAGLAALLLALTAAVPAWADSWEEGRKGSLTITASYVTGSGAAQTKNPVRDVEISLYQVAAASREGGGVTYTASPGLEAYQPLFNNGFSGTDNSAAAEEMSQMENLGSFQVQTAVKTSEEGKAAFTELEPGMYLVKQSAPRSDFYDMGPFLAAVPSLTEDGNSWIYDVEARPKLEKQPDPEKPGGGDSGGGGGDGGGGDNPPPTEPIRPFISEVPKDPGIPAPDITPGEFPDDKLPQTGMHRSWMLGLLCAGAACLGLGWKLGRRKLFLGLGILGILGAGVMEGKDLLEDRMAGQASAEAMKEIESWMEWAEEGKGPAGNETVGQEEDGTDLEDNQTGNGASQADGQSETTLDAAWLAAQSGYTGILSIPSLGLELPVQDKWSYPALRKTPCRYYGAAQSDDLVVFAHNYDRHFGNIKDMEAEDEVLFTDMDGQLHRYAVEEVMVISPYEAETMTAGEWDLILFTCTYGGENRVAVRCYETMEEALEQTV